MQLCLIIDVRIEQKHSCLEHELFGIGFLIIGKLL